MKTKRIVAVALTLCLVFSLLPFGAAAAQFQDVASGDYFYDAVEWAVSHEPQITKGTSETTFSPNNTCKRCEVVTFLWRAFGAEKMTAENPFEDVKPTDYFYDAAIWAVAEGITAGTDATHFSPSNPCTREQVATFLWRASEKPSNQCQVSPFADVLNKDRYSFDAILWAYENGVTNGKTTNTFAPGDPCTRGQIVTFLYRALEAKTAPPESDGRMHFQPKVASQFLTEVFGEKMVVAWFNLVDAVMAGETSFACPDDETFNWVIGQFPDKCFPPLDGLIWAADDPNHPVKNGVARIMYSVPYEEVQARIADFIKLVEDILNETMKPDYSDFENAVSLYNYFYEHYTYDWQAYEDNEEGKAYYLSSYRMLTGKTGICQEISVAYSYLLMQAGVNAATASGVGDDNAHHQWSYIRLNGREYHIDPTWVLDGSSATLAYFMMDDAQRDVHGGYSKDRFHYVANYYDDHPHPDYVANDNSFRTIWIGDYKSIDHENHTLYYELFSDMTWQWETRGFDYKDL